MICHYRHGHGRREPLATPQETGLSGHMPKTHETWGKITSQRPPRLSPADIALTAFRLGVSREAARQALEMGLFDG